MRRKLVGVLLAALALAAPGLSAAPSFKAVLITPKTAKVNVRWPWSVRVTTAAGKPLAGRVTVRIKDPIGGLHPVQFYKNTKNITRIPFKGTFADAVLWPATARGYPLTFQVIVQTAQGTRLLQHVVTVT